MNREAGRHAGGGDGDEPQRRGGHFSDGLAKRAQAVFRARTGQDVSEDEARAMLDNLTEFFHLLIEWDRRNADKNDLE